MSRIVDIEQLGCLAWQDGEHGTTFDDGVLWVLEKIGELPTIEPERKTGKWVHGREISREMIGDCITAILYDGWTCSECGCLVEKEREPLYKYCPNCGAKMEGSE